MVLPEGVAPPSDEQEDESTCEFRRWTLRMKPGGRIADLCRQSAAEPHNLDPTKERWQDLGVPDTI